MARIRQTAPRSTRALITLTRFYLPLDQDWPAWSVEEGGDPHAGPLKGVEGADSMRIGRLIDDPEQAVYIIDWNLLQNFKAFQSSLACAEFLRNLPESKINPASTISSAEMQQLTLDDGVTLSPTCSRFLLLKDCLELSDANFHQVITLTTFSVPGTLDSNTWPQLFNPLREKFNGSMPSGPPVTEEYRLNWHRMLNVWFMALEEDGWAAEKFGAAAKRESRGGDDASSHAIFCHLYRWTGFSNPRKQEAAAAADSEAAEKRQKALAKAKPPATAYVQERWTIRSIPSLRTEEDIEYENDEKGEEAEEDFSKVSRGLDQQNTALAAAQARIQQLEYQVDRLKPRKKQKIEPNPNGRFAQIEQVIETRVKLARQPNPATIAALNASYKFESLCLEWQLQ